jgi:drug/metabolite transporter (DMT)-like permease
MDTTSRSQLVNWGIFIILSVIWGSSFILMKEGMKSLNAWQVASVRIFSAGLVLLPFSINQLRSIPRKDLPLIFLSGMLGTFIPAYLFCLAETKLDSGVAGILNSYRGHFFSFQAAVEKMGRGSCWVCRTRNAGYRRQGREIQ